MAVLHPGSRVDLDAGERLVIQLLGVEERSLTLSLDSVSGATLAKRVGGRWVVEGPPGCTARLCLGPASSTVLSGRVTVRVSVPGQSRSTVASNWDLADVDLDGRVRVDVLDISRNPSDGWGIVSLQRRSADVIVGPVVEGADPPPAIVGEPSLRRIVVAFDRSASMHWAFEGPVIAELVQGVQEVRRLVLTADSSVGWFSYGSVEDESDGPIEVRSAGLAPREVAAGLTPELFSSGAMLATVGAHLHNADLLVAVTDSWPTPDVLTQLGPAAPALAVILVGLPADRQTWPTDWLARDRACDEAGMRTLAVGAGASAHRDTRDWLLKVLEDTRPPEVRSTP